MKKMSFFILGAAFVVTSCAEKLEQPVAKDDSNEQDQYEIFFTQDENSQDTKTAISQSGEGSLSITWEGTQASYVHLFENGDEGSSPSISMSDDKSTATFSAKFSGLHWSYEYSAIIAANSSSDIPILPAIQTPQPGSFDPAADILVGKSTKSSYVVRPSTVKMQFARVIALAQVQLSGLSEGEKVTSIEICAENKIAGPLKEMSSSCEFAGYDSDSQQASSIITLNFTEDNAASSDGTFNAYFGCWAVESGQIKVNVYTDQAKYQKSLEASSVLFRTKALKRLKVNLEGCKLSDQMYKLVTEDPITGWSGTYLFASSDKAGKIKVFCPSSESTNYTVDANAMMYDGGLIIGYDGSLDGCACEITSSGKDLEGEPLWNVMNYAAGGLFNISKWRYLYYDGGISLGYNNYSVGLKIETYYHSLGCNADGSADVRSITLSRSLFSSTQSVTGTYYLGYNAGSGFSYGESSSGPVYIYRLDDAGKQAQTLGFGSETVNWALADGKYSKGETYEVQAFTEDSAYSPSLLSYSSSDESVAIIDASSGRITIVGEGTTVITATASPSSEYRAATASYTLNIFTPYYRKVTSVDEMKDEGKYLIVAKCSPLLKTYYYAFDATDGDFKYTVNSGLFSSDVYDDGNKIKTSTALDTKRVVIKKNLFGSLASIVGLTGDTYAINPVALENQYMYCDMSTMTVLDENIPIPTYDIAFSEIKVDELSITGISNYFEKIATVPYNITFDADGKVSIANASSKYLSIGANLYYNIILGKYAYINFASIDNTAELLALMAKIDSSSPYSGILKLLSQVSGDDVEEVFSYFSADLYLYEYME